jgi:hypothetical protein
VEFGTSTGDVSSPLYNGYPATPVTVGWLASCTAKNNNKWYTQLPKLPWNFNSIYTQFTNVASGWRPVVFKDNNVKSEGMWPETAHAYQYGSRL